MLDIVKLNRHTYSITDTATNTPSIYNARFAVNTEYDFNMVILTHAGGRVLKVRGNEIRVNGNTYTNAGDAAIALIDLEVGYLINSRGSNEQPLLDQIQNNTDVLSADINQLNSDMQVHVDDARDAIKNSVNVANHDIVDAIENKDWTSSIGSFTGDVNVSMNVAPIVNAIQDQTTDMNSGFSNTGSMLNNINNNAHSTSDNVDELKDVVNQNHNNLNSELIRLTRDVLDTLNNNSTAEQSATAAVGTKVDIST